MQRVDSIKIIAAGTACLAAAILGGIALFAYFGAERPVVEAVPKPVPKPVPKAVPKPAAKAVSTAGFAEIVGFVSRSLRVVRFAGNDRILVFDFPNLTSQARALNRLAVLVEKPGAPRARVLGDAELAAYLAGAGTSAETLYFGHDYRAADVARFFNLARAGGIALNPDELALRGALIGHRFMRLTDGGYQAIPPDQALVSVVQLQADDPATPADETVDPGLRATILRHELSHGVFFTDRAYREYCERFWRRAMSNRERELFRRFLDSAGYDPANEPVMINEAQAFLMHTSDARAFSAAHLGVTEAALADLRRRFAKNAPPSARIGADRAFAGQQ